VAAVGAVASVDSQHGHPSPLSMPRTPLRASRNREAPAFGLPTGGVRFGRRRCVPANPRQPLLALRAGRRIGRARQASPHLAQLPVNLLQDRGRDAQGDVLAPLRNPGLPQMENARASPERPPRILAAAAPEPGHLVQAVVPLQRIRSRPAVRWGSRPFQLWHALDAVHPVVRLSHLFTEESWPRPVPRHPPACRRIPCAKRR
jgi:hypothetical protein